jgi:hypothetical protein
MSLEGGQCQYSGEVSVINLVNRRLLHHIVLKPCILFFVVDHVCY